MLGGGALCFFGGSGYEVVSMEERSCSAVLRGALMLRQRWQSSLTNKWRGETRRGWRAAWTALLNVLANPPSIALGSADDPSANPTRRAKLSSSYQG